MQMRGLGVMWSPDSPGNDAVKTRAEPGNPEAEKYLKYSQIITNDCLGKPFRRRSVNEQFTISLTYSCQGRFVL
jgi:hypothetical protein